MRARVTIVFLCTISAAAFAQDREERVLGTTLARPEVEELLRSAPIRRLRPVGRRGRTLEMRLDAPIDGLLVPPTHEDPDGWRHELAAYRVARCIGLDGVPPVVERPLSRETLTATLDPDFEDVGDALAEAIRWDAGGTTRAAAILRPADARPSGLGNWRRLEHRVALLRHGAEMDPQRERQVTDLAHAILFDYLVGHPSRFDGEPIPGVPSASRLFLVDHADAFAVPIDPDRHDRMWERVKRVEKLARWFAGGLARCDERALSRALAHGGEALLDDAELRALRDRREAIVSYVVALRDAFGDDAVFVLP